MATVRVPLDPRSFVPASTNGAVHKVVNGTNFPVVSLAFDAATDESAYIAFPLESYGSGNITFTIQWYADTASSGDVIWGAQLACITPNTDSQDIETKAFATAQTVTDSHIGTTNQRLHSVDLTISNLDSATTGDYVALRLYRDADAGGDTMTGDALFVLGQLSYSDT
jgi:hypothetical protein